MTIVNSDGMSISYDSLRLLKRLKKIVAVAEKEGNVLVSQKEIKGVRIIDKDFSLNAQSPKIRNFIRFQPESVIVC